MTTANLQLPELVVGQSQKEVTHNEALRILDVLAQGRVLDKDETSPPSGYVEGDAYIVADSATDDWENQDTNIAIYSGGDWVYVAPKAGWRVYVVDEAAYYEFDGAADWKITGVEYPVVTISANTTLGDAHRGRMVLVDTSGGAVTVTLPPAENGFTVAIVKATDDANTVTIEPDGSETIGGESSQVLEDQYGGTLVVSDGTDNWVGVGGGGSANLPLEDDEDLFANADDNTKLMRFDLSGISTSTTRTYSAPDKSGTLALLSDVTGGGIASDELDEDSGNTSGLTWAYNAGSIRTGSSITDVSAGDVTLTASDTNYVEIDPATGTVSVNTTGFTAGRIPLRELVTDGTGITSNTDRRAWLLGRVVFYSGLTEELPCADQVVSRPEIKDYAETRNAPASSGGTLDIDLENGNVQEPTLTENVTITLSNPPASGSAGSVTLILHQDATGGRSVTWPASVKWAGGSAPSLSTGADAIDVVTLMTTDGGSTWYGFLAGAGMA